jgi:hypothetical protein
MENSGTRNTATHQKQKFSSIKEEIEFRVANRITTDEESRTPGHYKYALLPRGASNPVWEK